METFVAYDDIISNKPIRDKSTLSWSYDEMQDLFKPISYGFGYNSVYNIT